MKSLVACALALMVTAPALVVAQAQKAADSEAVAAVTKVENECHQSRAGQRCVVLLEGARQ